MSDPITVTIIPDEPSDRDESNPTGMTRAAYERLSLALIEAGFSIIDIA